MAALTIDGISKKFEGRGGSVLALDNINLEVQTGEFVMLVGPSGCGKSTLLNIIAGLDKPTAGEVREDGRRIVKPGRDRGVVFQEGALFPWLTVRKNVEFGLKQMGMGTRERADRAERYLHLVHLSRFADSYVHELSGGMRQRVAIARALAPDPDILLMDEPFSALDAQTRDDLYVILQEIWRETGKTIVFVTHNIREAACLGDRVVVMSARPGKIEAVIPVQIARPRFVDDTDVAKTAQQIALTLRDSMAQNRREEYDADWRPAERGVLRPVDGVLGDSI
jgi:NitT/TauT family transport system ATP-binding protein